MTADPPKDLTNSGGIVGDAGQHSYGARNAILFGQWSFDDWKPYIAAPVTDVLINYPIYKILGISLLSHRIIPFVFSALTLLLLTWIVLKEIGLAAGGATALFLSFNYPLIMYSKTANRYFPMAFFFILALYFFCRGRNEAKSGHFVLSTFFLMLSFLSQNHVIYLISLFFVLTVLWRFQKRITWGNLLWFWASLSSLLTGWYVLVYLSNRHFFDFFVGHNKLVRRIYSPEHLIQNILQNPFLTQFRSSPVILFLSVLAVGVYVTRFLGRRKDIPAFIEASVLWLLIGAAFHSIWNYRPTRFYLIMALPAAVLAGWLIQLLLRRKLRLRLSFAALFGAAAAGLSLIIFGIIPYSRSIRRINTTAEGYILIICVCLVAAGVAVLPWKRRYPIWIACLMILLGSSYLNLGYFFSWANQREYRILNTSRVLSKVIPPSNIAGNWASLLSTGTPHKTHLLSGEMGVNWRRNFFKEQNIRYLLITKGRFGSEIREYTRMFGPDLETARLLALFRMYNTDVYLFELGRGHENLEDLLEFEAFARDMDRGMVVFDSEASSDMSLLYRRDEVRPPIQISTMRDFKVSGLFRMEIRAKGPLRAEVIFKQNKTIIKRSMLKFTGGEYALDDISDIPLKKDLPLTIVLKVSAMEETFCLDSVRIEPMQTSAEGSGPGRNGLR